MNAELQKKTAPPVVLTIAGFDPSSGAGVTADLKVFAAHGLYGVSAITALTVQSTQGVRRMKPVSSELLEETLACLADDVEIAGVKIGMLATASNVAAVSRFLAGIEVPRGRVVLDPVIRSSSGRELLDAAGLRELSGELLPRVGWITPNREELAALIGRRVEGREEIPTAAGALQAGYPGLNIVVTGGDANPPNDFLRIAEDGEAATSESASGDELEGGGDNAGSGRGASGGAGRELAGFSGPDGGAAWRDGRGLREFWLEGERVETSATHGTGCTFSSALLAAVVSGKRGAEAVKAAKEYVSGAMRAAYEVGKGAGPLHHLYRFQAGRRLS